MWVWIDTLKDDPNDKFAIDIIKSIVASVDAGYKDDGQDFYRLAEYLKRIITTNKTIDDISTTKAVAPSTK